MGLEDWAWGIAVVVGGFLLPIIAQDLLLPDKRGPLRWRSEEYRRVKVPPPGADPGARELAAHAEKAIQDTLHKR